MPPPGVIPIKSGIQHYRHIKIDEATSLRLSAVDGDVEVGRLTGPAHITTARGSITIAEAARGTLELRTQMGDITLGATPGASAALDAGTGHGRVHNALVGVGSRGMPLRGAWNWDSALCQELSCAPSVAG